MTPDLDELERIGKAAIGSDVATELEFLPAAKANWQVMIDEIRRLRQTIQRREHHGACSMTARPVEECSLCQRLFTQAELEDDIGRKCVEYCATTHQAIRKDIRDEAVKAWETMKPLSG